MMKQIGLSEQEAKQFFPLYEEMEGKKWTVDREARTFARKIVRSETAVSDVEYEKAAEVLLEKDEKLAKIDRVYYDKFKTFLSNEKLFKFKNAQMKFPRAMMKWHGGIMKKGRSFFDLLPFFLFMVQISSPKNRLYEGYTIRYSIRVLSIRFGFRARHLFYRSIL